MSESARRAYRALVEYLGETRVLESCGSLLFWDQQTYMPKRGSELRARQNALVKRMLHARLTAPEFRDLVEAAEPRAAETGPESPEAANLREARRELDRQTRIPGDLVSELASATTLSQEVWVEARSKGDFGLFRPALERVLELTRRRAEALGYEDHPYDPLVDHYEPGETTASVREVFLPLREVQVALLDRILGSGTEVDASFLEGSYPVARQVQVVEDAARTIGFDFERGRLDVTTHPFCSGAGPLDVRLTTRYHARRFNDAFFSVLHEAGHGIYEQGLPVENYGTPMGSACSLGIHESQSRLWENLVGRSRGFWEHFHPTVQSAFPETLEGVDTERFYRAVNEARPSLIRVEADEVTYNLHIFLRFELELALLEGDLAPADLPGAWNETFERFLGLRPPDDASGCLQDIHWSAGLIGYFPTYALGNLYASQLYEAAETELGDLQEAFARGEFEPLRRWLNEKVHRHGKRYRPRRLVEVVTGQPLSHEPMMRHIESKYAGIYGL